MEHSVISAISSDEIDIAAHNINGKVVRTPSVLFLQNDKSKQVVTNPSICRKVILYNKVGLFVDLFEAGEFATSWFIQIKRSYECYEAAAYWEGQENRSVYLQRW